VPVGLLPREHQSFQLRGHFLHSDTRQPAHLSVDQGLAPFGSLLSSSHTVQSSAQPLHAISEREGEHRGELDFRSF
jgi:hypothetical protein